MMQEGRASLKGYQAQLKDSQRGSLKAEKVEILDLTYVLNDELKESGRR